MGMSGMAELAGIVGPQNVLTSPDLTASYTTDWTRRYGGPALAVVRPGSTEEVAQVLRWCARRRVPVIPQGGNTGLVGGSVPLAVGAQDAAAQSAVIRADQGARDRGKADRGEVDQREADQGARDRGKADRGEVDRGEVDQGEADQGARDRGKADRGEAVRGEAAWGEAAWGAGRCLVLSLTRLRRLDPVDTLSGQVTAGAGVTLAALRAHAADAGLEYGVDLAARDSATVGGTVATNAGGVRTIRFGATRQQVLGLEMVSAHGAVMAHLAGLPMDNSGYHLAELATGSEGTLAVITAARLRLWPAEPVAAVALTGVAGIEAAVRLQAAIRAKAGGVRALEYFEAAGLELVRAVTGLPLPLGRAYPAYLLAELAGTAGTAGTDDAAQRLADAGLREDAAVAIDGPGQQRLWAYRERATEAISAAGVPHKLDVAVPLARIAEFRARLDEVAHAAAGPDCLVIVFGHLGVGNLHVNLLGPDPGDVAADEAVLRLAVSLGGTISAEHGVGRAKARWLPLCRSPAEIAAMWALKQALDPAGLLNPGVLLG